MSQLPTAAACPECGARGKPVGAVTLHALLTPSTLPSIRTPDGWRHCASVGCATAYYHPESGDRVACSGVSVRIGTKETAAPRPLCYCFGLTAEDIEAEVASSGGSTIADRITEQCRRGLDRCAETNPQGSCCLGNVRAAEHGALQGAITPVADCCASTASPAARDDRAVTWASVSAMGSAVLSSACCWLPLVLVALGVSGGGVAGFVDAYRPWLLGGAATLLAVALRLTYRRADCGSDGSCAPPAPRLVSLNKALLWIATAVVVGFAAFPSFVGRIVSGSLAQPGAAPPSCCTNTGAHAGRSDR